MEGGATMILFSEIGKRHKGFRAWSNPAAQSSMVREPENRRGNPAEWS